MGKSNFPARVLVDGTWWTRQPHGGWVSDSGRAKSGEAMCKILTPAMPATTKGADMAAKKKTTRKKAPAKKTTRKKAAKKTAKKTTRKKATRKKATTKKRVAKKTTAKKATRKKAPAKKTARKKATTKKATTQKRVAKKTTAKKATRKKAPAKKTTRKKAAKRGQKQVTAAQILQGGPKTPASVSSVWICAGPKRTGCGGGKAPRQGSRVIGVLR